MGTRDGRRSSLMAIEIDEGNAFATRHGNTLDRAIRTKNAGELLLSRRELETANKDAH